MEYSALKFDDDTEFVQMFNKIHINQRNSTPLESPSNYRMTALTSSPYSPIKFNELQPSDDLRKRSKQKSAVKSLDFSNHQDNAQNNNTAEDIDLNKTYSSKTMDPKQLALMLAVLEDDDKED